MKCLSRSSMRLTLLVVAALAAACGHDASQDATAAQPKNVSKLTQALSIPQPEPVNPLLAMLPDGVDPDMDAWAQWFEQVSAEVGPLTLAGAQAQLSEQEPNNDATQATPLPGVGTGAGDLGHVVVTGSILAGFGADPDADPDFFQIELEAGDVIGVNATGAPRVLELRLLGPELTQRLGSTVEPVGSDRISKPLQLSFFL